jgi:hypothetical protein
VFVCACACVCVCARARVCVCVSTNGAGQPPVGLGWVALLLFVHAACAICFFVLLLRAAFWELLFASRFSALLFSWCVYYRAVANAPCLCAVFGAVPPSCAARAVPAVHTD